MAKFNIEVELDWVDEEAGYTIDEEIKEQVVRGVKDALLRKATDEAVQFIMRVRRETLGYQQYVIRFMLNCRKAESTWSWKEERGK